jgi:FAD dependent oxidoreductase
MEINRRQFMHAGILGTAFAGARRGRTDARASDGSNANFVLSETYREAGRDIPIVERADVIVCGAGPAGIAAALAAARTGAKTWLIEANGCLGGIWTAGLLCWILDTRDKGGILHQITSALQKRGAGYVNKEGYSFGYDPEAMKLLLEQMCVESQVNVRLHTQVVSAATDDSGRLCLAITESKSGRRAWEAKTFVDATGDGDLAARAGCKFDVGRKADGSTQPMSMMAILTGVRYEHIKQFVRGTERDADVPKRLLQAEIIRAGVDPSYSKPTLFRIYDDLFCLAANHEYGYSATDAAQITQATLHARAEVNKIVDALRRLGGAWKDLRLAATNEHIGVREGRRIHGRYTISEADLVNGTRHDDAVCRVYFGVDVHSPDRSEGKGIAETGIKSKPYDIPLRALIARDVDGLLIAGRCISGDFVAHSSYRVTGCAVATGQAAGVAAALAALNNRQPQDVPWTQFQAAQNKLNS